MIPGIQKIRLHSKRKERAAQLVANGGKTNLAIAKELGITERTLYRWLTNPHFRARVEEIVREYSERVMNGTLGSRSKRLAKLQELSEKLDVIIAERAQDPLHSALPGGETGLVVLDKLQEINERRRKIDPETGQPFDPPIWETVRRYVQFVSVDSTMLGQYQKIIDQIGDILGDNVQRSEIRLGRIEDLSDDEVFALEKRLLGDPPPPKLAVMPPPAKRLP